MVNLLHFKVQQVAVNLVVDVGVIFLLAQVKAGDIHRRLKRETYCWLVKVNIKTSEASKNQKICFSVLHLQMTE